jgi:hypothetical protein
MRNNITSAETVERISLAACHFVSNSAGKSRISGFRGAFSQHRALDACQAKSLLLVLRKNRIEAADAIKRPLRLVV